MGSLPSEVRRVRNSGFVRLAIAALAAVALVGCASPNKYRAPVEDRAVTNRPAGSTATAPNGAASSTVAAALPTDTKVLPGAENAGKPGFYTVKPGDTLIRVGLETGQNWKDIIKWNNLDNPNVIEVGQVLRVTAPGADPNAVATRGVTSSKLETRPLDAPKAQPAAASGTAPVPTPVAVAPPSATLPTPPAPREGDDDINWLWPATGPVVGAFDETRTKGLAIAGKAGDPVMAAADGKVVYAGSGLRGYGNLVILKHNNTYLTAYAHNQALLVKEEQTVKRGQKIAEMGATDAERVQLHFEIRKQGKPVDPARILPPR
ncbi:MAG TPA: peptidoglycan DD-metalloendopeptidase family protein [Rhizobacter sp.]|nr:peptidoglycan DD-metalloendopeptidase family protein [Rhizobacter sp.]